jgi:hypothetical protein
MIRRSLGATIALVVLVPIVFLVSGCAKRGDSNREPVGRKASPPPTNPK